MKKNKIHTVCLFLALSSMIGLSAQNKVILEEQLEKDPMNVQDSLISKQALHYRLFKGTNLISFPLVPKNASCEHVFETLINSGVLIKVQDEQGKSFEQFTASQWLNEIGNITQNKAYRVEVKSNCTFKMTGEAEDKTNTWKLLKGWNMMPYLGLEDGNALIILSELIKKGTLVMVKDDRGNTLQKDDKGTWINNIGNLQPTKSYEVKVSRKAEVFF